MPVLVLCRKHEISKNTYYKWKQKYDGMEVSDIKRRKEFEAENSKPKRIFADMVLENATLKDMIKKTLTPGEKKEVTECMAKKHQLSIARACSAVNMARPSQNGSGG